MEEVKIPIPERSIISAVQGCIRAALEGNIEILRNPAEKMILMIAFAVVWPLASQVGGKVVWNCVCPHCITVFWIKISNFRS